jgi:hypothetical protein
MKDLTELLSNLPTAVTSAIQQYQQGNHDAVPDAQAHEAYTHVAGQLSSDEFQQVASNAYAQLNPQQRTELADYMRSQAQQHGISVPDLPPANAAAPTPDDLGNATAKVQEQGSNVLQQLFAPGGTFSNPIAKMALLGITAMAAQQLTKRR